MTIAPDELIGVPAGETRTVFHKWHSKCCRELHYIFEYEEFRQGQIDGDYSEDYRPCKRCWRP